MSKDTRSTLTYVAGDPWLNLVATAADRIGPDPFERLWDTERLREWLHHEYAVADDITIDEAELASARRLREALWTLATATVRGTALSAGAVKTVNDALRGYRPCELTIDGGRLRTTPPPTVPAALGWLARKAVADLTTPDTAAMLRICAADGCGAVFADPSGRRRWCPSGRCGVKSRVRAHRSRARESAT